MDMNQYSQLTSLGDFYPLKIGFDKAKLMPQLEPFKSHWRQYNPRKPNIKRQGLSLFSIDGSSSGEIDLDSLLEYNRENGTNYDESSFRQPTEHWIQSPELSLPFKEIESKICRSHIIRFSQGGFFPPHRDLDDTFRLISFFNANPDSLSFIVDDKKVFFESFRLYFVNTRKTHSLLSFQDNVSILVLNISVCPETVSFVIKNLKII